MQVGLINNISQINELNKNNILDPYKFSSKVIVSDNFDNLNNKIDVELYLLRNFRTNKFSIIFKTNKEIKNFLNYFDIQFDIIVNGKTILKNSKNFNKYGLILDEKLNLSLNRLNEIKIIVKNNDEELYQHRIQKSDNIINNFEIETKNMFFTIKIPYVYKFESSSNNFQNRKTIFNFQTFIKFEKSGENVDTFAKFSSNFNLVSDNEIFRKVSLYFPKFLNLKLSNPLSKKEIKLIDQNELLNDNFINENIELKFNNLNIIFNKNQEYNNLLSNNLIKDLNVFSFDISDVSVIIKHKKFYDTNSLKNKIEKIAISVQDINTLQNNLIHIKNEDWVEFINLEKLSYDDFIIYIRKKYEI